MLNPSRARDSLPVRWARDRGFYVENLFFVECDTVDDLTAVLEEGMVTHDTNTTCWYRYM